MAKEETSDSFLDWLKVNIVAAKERIGESDYQKGRHDTLTVIIDKYKVWKKSQPIGLHGYVDVQASQK